MLKESLTVSQLANDGPAKMLVYARWFLLGICIQFPVVGQAKLELLEAVRSGLQRNPQLDSQRAQIGIAAGAKQFETGAFDPLMQSGFENTLTNAATLIPGNPAQIGPETRTFAQNAMSLGASKLFRNGISVSPSYSTLRTSNSLLYPKGYSSTLVGISVSIPLLRGRGAVVVAARERAASLEVRASEFDLDFAIANIARIVGNAYWNLVAAYRNLDVATASARRGQIYVDNTQALIEADHVPRSDLFGVTGNLTRRRALQITAENLVISARQNLAVASGLSAEEITTELLEPADDFPETPNGELPSNLPLSLGKGLQKALGQRADYLAALTRKEKATTLLPAAQNALLPNVSLTAGSGYEGLRAGGSLGDFLASPVGGLRGPNVTGGISFSVPMNRNSAYGTLQQTRAGVLQADALVRDTARFVSQGVTVAVANVRASIQRVEVTRVAVEAITNALNGVREKYIAGIGSVVEILQMEDTLNSALADEVQARFEYALSLIQYRFATGTLVPAGQAAPVIERKAFFDPIPNVEP
ncbi:MAG: TolC family protein [Bryobacteraceae bacterium]|nr:TolC family protein [Bryobacteraceae bacterium]